MDPHTAANPGTLGTTSTEPASCRKISTLLASSANTKSSAVTVVTFRVETSESVRFRRRRPLKPSAAASAIS
jgi:hypothetical protein